MRCINGRSLFGSDRDSRTNIHRNAGHAAMWIACFTATLLFVVNMTVRAEDLPVNAQADVLKHQIAEAIKSNRDQDALAALDRYHQLEKKGVKIPPLILFIEAQVAKRAGDPRRAYEAVSNFLKVAQSSEPHYQDAIAMYSTLSDDPAVKADLAARAEAKRQEQQARALAAARASREEEAAKLEQQRKAAQAAELAQAQEQARASAAARAKFIADLSERLNNLEKKILDGKYTDCGSRIETMRGNRIDACFQAAQACLQRWSCKGHALKDQNVCGDAANTWAAKAESECVQQRVCPLLPEYNNLAASAPVEAFTFKRQTLDRSLHYKECE
jgi:hypothetical protein